MYICVCACVNHNLNNVVFEIVARVQENVPILSRISFLRTTVIVDSLLLLFFYRNKMF